MSKDSKLVGFLYFLLSFLGGMMGFSYSVPMSIELSSPFSVFEETYYFVCVTSHGFLMMFYFITLVASGFSNMLLPNMCFLEDMFFEELNVFSFFLIVMSLVFVLMSLIIGEGVSCGWTLYTPLSNLYFSLDFSMDFLITGVHLFSLSSILGAVNNLMTMFMSFYDFESFFDMSPFVWSYFMTSILVLFSMPALTCVLTMLLFDSSFGTYFFDTEFGGDSLLFQTMFWYFGHPEVYILMLPVFGVVTQVMLSLNDGYFFNSEGLMCSMFSLGLLSFLVFGHHMTTVGWGVDVSSFFMSSTMAISIPTGVKVFSWLFNLYFYSEGFSLISCLLVIFMLHFCFGGITGFFLSNSSLDFFLHDTWFVVGHFHVVLAMSSFLGFLVGVMWIYFDKFKFVDVFILGECFLVIFCFFSNLFFLPFHMLGFLGLPSSMVSYSFEYYFWFYLESMSFLGLWIFIVLCVSFLFINILL